jgi:hypothetical protein
LLLLKQKKSEERQRNLFSSCQHVISLSIYPLIFAEEKQKCHCDSFYALAHRCTQGGGRGVRGLSGIKVEYLSKNFIKHIYKNAIKGMPSPSNFTTPVKPPPKIFFWQKPHGPSPWIFKPCASTLLLFPKMSSTQGINKLRRVTGQFLIAIYVLLGRLIISYIKDGFPLW